MNLESVYLTRLRVFSVVKINVFINYFIKLFFNFIFNYRSAFEVCIKGACKLKVVNPKGVNDV